MALLKVKYSYTGLLLSHFSRVWLCATPRTAAHQALPSLGFSRQEHWSGLPFPFPTHESEKWKWSGSVVSDPQRPHGLQPCRLLCPWDSPGKSTGVGCRCLLQRMKVKSESEVAQSCPTLSDPMDCSPPGSSVRGILQARALEWGAVAFSDTGLLLLLLLSRFSRVRLCATPQTAAHQAPLSLGFSRQEPWSGLPFPSPMHESEKWKWSRS